MLRERIRDLRRELKITQAELAERLNVHLQTVSKWERGISEPDISQLGELSVALSVSIERLCGLPEDSETYAGSFSTESLGESISRLRTQRNESQEELAEVLNSSVDAVSRWERGITSPNAEQLAALASHFGLSVSRLYYGFEESDEGPVVIRPLRRSRVRLLIVLAVAVVVLLLGGGIALGMAVDSARQGEIYTVTVDGVPYEVPANSWFQAETPVKEGYEFLGWRNEQGELTLSFGQIASDMSYTSVFEPTLYTIDCWLNGGYFAGDVPAEFTVESGSIELPVPKKEGDRFDGWYLSRDYSGDPVERIDCEAEDAVLYAKWSKEVFTVRYELNGGVLFGANPDTVTREETVSLVDPVREGYLFLGWYDAMENGARYETVGGETASNLTLYALWQRSNLQFTIYYDLNGGMTLGNNPVSVGAGEVHELFGAEKEGYDFVGWNSKADGSGDWFERLYGVSDTLYLYAVFTPRTYIIRYVYEGSYEGEETNPSEIVYGESITLLPVYQYGHRFLGWYDSETGGECISVIDASNITRLTTLYARFVLQKYSILLDGADGFILTQEGEKSTVELTLSFGEEIELPDCIRDGFVFLGWYDEAGEKVGSINIVNIRDMHLTARWRRENSRYHVTYFLDGGEMVIPNPESVLCGEAVILNEPVKEGYLFLGWYLEPEGEGKPLTVLPATQEEDVVLYAVWQKIETSGSYRDFEYEMRDNSVSITAYHGETGKNVELVIPSVIDGKPVVEVRGLWNGEFGLMYFESVDIPSSVSILGEEAFGSFSVTEPIEIPASVETIGYHAFRDTYAPGIVFADGSRLQTLEEESFSGAHIEGLLELPEGVQTIGNRAFYLAYILDVKLPDGLKYIGSEGLYVNRTVFYYDIMNSLYIPASVEYIGANAICAENVYLPFGEDHTQSFSPTWNKSVQRCRYNVRSVELRVHVGEETTVLNGNVFEISDPVREGYHFLGWKNESGHFVRRYIVTDAETDLYAVFEEASDTDGRTKEHMAVLQPGLRNEFMMRTTANARDEFYFVPDVSEGSKLTVEIGGAAHNDDDLYYCAPDGTETIVTSGKVIAYHAGGYFVLRCNYLFECYSVSVFLSVVP